MKKIGIILYLDSSRLLFDKRRKRKKTADLMFILQTMIIELVHSCRYGEFLLPRFLFQSHRNQSSLASLNNNHNID